MDKCLMTYVSLVYQANRQIGQAPTAPMGGAYCATRGRLVKYTHDLSFTAQSKLAYRKG